MKFRATAMIDRDPQNLPVPLGGMTPVRVIPSRRRRGVRCDLARLLVLSGVVTGAAGLALLLAPPHVAVSLVGDHLEVGGMVLTAVGPTGTSRPARYQGDASYVLVERRDGTAAAAATWASGGTSSTGVCRLHRDGLRLIDECAFTLSSARLTSVDVLDPARGSTWERTYGDGVVARIDVSPDGGAVPVPFPIGH